MENLIFTERSFDEKSSNGFPHLLHDGPVGSCKISIFDILFCQCRTSTNNTSSLEIFPDASEFCLYIYATMFIESSILNSEDILYERDIKTSRIGDHISSYFPFFCYLYSIPIKKSEAPIFHKWSMSNGNNSISYEKYRRSTHGNTEYEEKLSHIHEYRRKEKFDKMFFSI